MSRQCDNLKIKGNDITGLGGGRFCGLDSLADRKYGVYMGRKRVEDQTRIKTLSLGLPGWLHQWFEVQAGHFGLTNHEMGEALLKAIASARTRGELKELVRPHVRRRKALTKQPVASGDVFEKLERAPVTKKEAL